MDVPVLSVMLLVDVVAVPVNADVEVVWEFFTSWAAMLPAATPATMVPSRISPRAPSLGPSPSRSDGAGFGQLERYRRRLLMVPARLPESNAVRVGCRP